MGLPKQFIHKVSFLAFATVLALTPLLLPLQQLSAPAIAQAATILAVVGSPAPRCTTRRAAPR